MEKKKIKKNLPISLSIRAVTEEEEMFPEHIEDTDDIAKETFDSNKLNFNEDIRDVEDQELLSPMFTNGFDNLKKAFISCDKNEAEQKQFFEDFKNRLTDEGVVEDHKKFEEIVNSTLKSSRKKFSVNKPKHAQPEYSDLKFTHRNVMNFKSKKRRIPEEEKSTKDDHVEHIQESICTDQSIS